MRLGVAISALGPAGMAARLRVDSPLLRHASVLFLATLAGQMLGFAVQIALARTIGIASYGLYAYAFTWISFLALLAVMGSDRLLIRFLSEYGAAGEHGLFRGVLAWSLGFGLAASVLVGLAFYGLRLWLDPPGSPEAARVLAWTVATLPLMVTAALVEGALRGCEAHAAATWPSRVLRPLLFVLLVVVLAHRGGPHDASWALGLNVAAVLLACLPALAALRPLLPPRPAAKVPLPGRLWLATSAFLGLNTLALYLNGQIDMLVLGVFADHAALGAYGAVLRIVTVVSLASVAVIAIIQPMLAAARAQGRDLGPLVRGGARLIFLASAAAGAIVLLFAGDLLAIFGEPFRAGATALRLLAAAQIGTSLVSLAGPLLNMTGHERHATSIMVAGAVLNLALNLLLAPAFGITGAATATALSALGWNLGLFLTARARIGVVALPLAPRARAVAGG